MKSFIAIDVETANFEPSSICSIGAVKVVDGVIVDRKYSLVCPEPNYYAYRCRCVHGLGDKDTFDAPSFGRVWEQWQPWLEGFRLIAHNAAFDSKCIKSACRIYGLAEPENWDVPSRPPDAKSHVMPCRRNRLTAFAIFSA